MKLVLDVTVIIPTYNSRETIARALNSVYSQTKLPNEIIIIDDKSNDKTDEELICTVKSTVKTTILRNTSNLGPGMSRNLGWDMAKSEWIAFLDADDSWHPQKLELQFRAMNQLEEIDLICTDTILFSKEHYLKNYPDNIPFSKVSFHQMLFRNSIPTRSVLLRKQIPYRFPKGLSEDYALWLCCLDRKLQVAKLQAPLTFHYRPEFSKGGLSGDLLSHEFYELKRILKYFCKQPLLVFFACNFSLIKFFRRITIRFLRSVNS